MRLKALAPLLLLSTLACAQAFVRAQGTVPTFVHTAGAHTYTLAGSDPGQGVSTSLPTILVPIALTLASGPDAQPVTLDAKPDVPAILASPIFTSYAFAPGNSTQYADAMLRTTFPGHAGWHTLLAKPAIKPLAIHVPAAYGYLLTSKKSGGSLAVIDADYIQTQLFKLLPKQENALIVAVLHNAIFYADSDATICCTWGTHGVDASTGSSFVLSSYLQGTPAIVTARDVQPLSQQVAQFFNDPRHDPKIYGYNVTGPGNAFPRWMRLNPEDGCGGAGIGSSYFLLEPTETNPKNNIPASPAFVAKTGRTTYHLENVALLPWYLGGSSGGTSSTSSESRNAASPGAQTLGGTYSFPSAGALPAPAVPCTRRSPGVHADHVVLPTPVGKATGKHRLIGYWTGHGPKGQPFPLREVSPQWDTIIVAFASPEKGAPEGTLHFAVPEGIDPAQFKADIATLKSQGKQVMLSLGGGGAYFTLADSGNIPNFVSSVTKIVSEYGFQGVDIDFESPSLVIDADDKDFRHPTTPSIVNLITGLRQLHDHFGSGFLLSLVPEGPQIPAGYVSYGGQFGSYLPLTYALADILTFVDIQDYNTPPLEGLDGEIYQSHSVDYHAALTELLLHGFDAGRNASLAFPPLAAEKVAVGFLTDYDTPDDVRDAMEYLLTGKAPAGASYLFRKSGGYPETLGAMFWTIDDDRRGDFEFSNVIGPQLHGDAGAE